MHLPRTLAPRLQACGFEVDRIFVLTLLNASYSEAIYSHHLARLIADFVRGSNAVPEDELEAWLAQLVSLDEAGAYFFSLNRYCFHAISNA